MRKLRCATIVVLALLARTASGQVPSSELVERGRAYDGKEIDFTGEVIGDPMPRGDHLWINVTDGENALGVWVGRSAFPPNLRFGSYRATGDTIRVQGTYHDSCPEHGGDTDIHAAAITVFATGAPTEHAVKRSSVVLAGVLLGASIATFTLWRRRERKKRPS